MQGSISFTLFFTIKTWWKIQIYTQSQTLNKHLYAPHFKMEDIRTAKQLISKGNFLATFDLKNAYFLVPIFQIHKKFLRFQFNGSLYDFQCFHLDYPRLHIFLPEPIFKYLREQNILSVVFLDDIIIISKDWNSVVNTFSNLLKPLKN